MCSASKCVPPWLAPAQRGRVAIVKTSNLKTHTSAGSLLVRRMLTELQEHLSLVYTPVYDPDANRIEWLWRVSRQVVTHHHHRSTFELLLADVEQHCRDTGSDSRRGPSAYRQSVCPGQGSGRSSITPSGRIIILEA
jgi:transposase